MISNYLISVAVCPFTFSGCRGVAKRRHGSEWLRSFRRDRRPRLSVYIFGMSRRHPLQGNIHFCYSLFVWWVSPVFRTTNGRPYGEAILSPITYHFSFSKPLRRSHLITYHLSLLTFPCLPQWGKGDHVSGGRSQITPSVNSVASSLWEGAFFRRPVTNDTKKVQENVKNYFILLKYFLDLFIILC